MQSRIQQSFVAVAVALLVGLGGLTAAIAEVEHRVDINTASVAELATLPGIGESKAKAIVEYRAADPFRSVEDLKKVKGIGDKTFESLKPSLMVSDASGATSVTFDPPGLPFTIQLGRYQKNSRVLPKGPVFDAPTPVIDGVFLQPQPTSTQAEQNIAGLYVTTVDKQGGAKHDGLLWGNEAQPWTVESGGKRYAIGLRRERYPMPFTIALKDFIKEDHPRIDMPKAFSSDVTVTENGSTRPVKISMNEPLRSKGLVVYQASWGPADAPPGTPLFSTLAVVSNPADQFPLYACIVIAIGLSMHFARKLLRHIRSEARAS